MTFEKSNKEHKRLVDEVKQSLNPRKSIMLIAGIMSYALATNTVLQLCRGLLINFMEWPSAFLFTQWHDSVVLSGFLCGWSTIIFVLVSVILFFSDRYRIGCNTKTLLLKSLLLVVLFLGGAREAASGFSWTFVQSGPIDMNRDLMHALVELQSQGVTSIAIAAVITVLCAMPSIYSKE